MTITVTEYDEAGNIVGVEEVETVTVPEGLTREEFEAWLDEQIASVEAE